MVGVVAFVVVGVPPPPPPLVPPPPRVVVGGKGPVVVVGAVVLVVVVQGSLGVVPVPPPALVPPAPRVVGVVGRVVVAGAVGRVVVAGAVVLVVVAQGSLAVLRVVLARPQAAAATPKPRTRHTAMDARPLGLTAKLRRRRPPSLEVSATTGSATATRKGCARVGGAYVGVQTLRSSSSARGFGASS